MRRAARRAAIITSTALLASLLAPPAWADADGWRPFANEDVIEIVTTDANGDERETKVWIVVVDGSGYVRTNDSRWLANIRRGSAVALRAREWESRVRTEERDDLATRDRVEEAFKEKYGVTQRLMSFFRISEPTVLQLTLAGPSGKH